MELAFDKPSPFVEYKAGETVIATCDFTEGMENVKQGQTDTIESVSSNHHGGLQLNLVGHGRGWSNHVWRKA